MFIESVLTLINLFIIPILACRWYYRLFGKKWYFSAEFLYDYCLIAVANLFPAYIITRAIEHFTPFICNMGGKKYTLAALVSSFIVVGAISIFQKTVKFDADISSRFGNGKKPRFYRRYWFAILIWLLTAVIFLFAMFIQSGSLWIEKNLNVDYEQLLFTVRSPLKGADTSVVGDVIREFFENYQNVFFCLFIASGIVLFAELALISFDAVVGKLHIKCADGMQLVRIAALILSLAILCRNTVSGLDKLGYYEYKKHADERTEIYEKYYVDPDNVKITKTRDTGNLILIYLESMETTYASAEAGGAQPTENYIPNLTRLAGENINFSDNDKLGGFGYVTGATWTSAALLASNTGIPFAFPISQNDMEYYKHYAANASAIGNILEKNGYEQVFLCGSDGEFGGRNTFFKEHGDYYVKDYNYALENGLIPGGYHVNWGYEDSYLYEIAKKELIELAEQGKPFNLTMLTVDTHFPKGYICSLCSDEYPTIAENAVKCADRQLNEFILWLREQNFYDDTTIVVMGDHFRMDNELIPDNADRAVYNCFINSRAKPVGSIKNREFMTMDMFPTIISAMGFEIAGDRLGLGTDLFSGRATIAEEMGTDALNIELTKSSEYYIKKFT